VTPDTRDVILRTACDRTISENHLRNEGFISQDHIGGLSMKREYMNTTHISIQYHMKFKLKLLQIKCHALEFIKDEAPKDNLKDKSEFCGSVHLSR
jgi:hypothetical protein